MMEDDDGIIPARAGFTTGASRTSPRSPDHPRSRGVYPDLEVFAASVTGSSPLARGLPSTPSRQRRPVGIIPARAGFTMFDWTIGDINDGSSPLARGLLPRTSSSSPRRRDHPRSRGVYITRRRRRRRAMGSSPLARGLRNPMPWRRGSAGIIPARAGFTSMNPIQAVGAGDHPRSRGVYSCRFLTLVVATWIIPARAGFTCPKSGAA